MRMKLAALVAVPIACAAAAGPACAEYPSRSVRVVVGAPGGDPIDLMARFVTPALSTTFRQPFIVDNQVGAMGNVAAGRVAKAPADGHTLLVVSASFATSVSLYPDLAYEPQRDFTAVAKLASFNQVLVVNSTLSMRTLAEFLSFVRAAPGRVTIASAGTGTTSHLAAELMKIRAGWLDALHVPYRGNGPALVDVLGNHVHAAIATIALAHPHVRTGRLRALAVASAKRVAPLAEVPTFHESGFPGFEATAWSGIVAPAGTSYDTVVRLNLAVREAMSNPQTKQRFGSQGAAPANETPEQFRQFLRDEIEKWGKVAKAI
jgi:tripartite-type tricarboxylate transporter receptor subunit TctC